MIIKINNYDELEESTKNELSALLNCSEIIFETVEETKKVKKLNYELNLGKITFSKEQSEMMNHIIDVKIKEVKKELLKNIKECSFKDEINEKVISIETIESIFKSTEN